MTDDSRIGRTVSFFHSDFSIHSLSELKGFARRFSPLLYSGLFLGFRGDLGSGKTTLVREILKGLDCPVPEYVTSPTFVLVQEYPARIPVSHMDLYRLKNDREFLHMGGMDMFPPENIIMVEWVERMESLLPENRIELHIQIMANNSRLISVRGFGQLKKLVETWAFGVS